jgi:U32 family peptidase
MKGSLYLASVTRAYRQAIDRYLERPDGFLAEPNWMEDVLKVSHRPYTKGLLFDGPEISASDIETRISYIQTHTLAGLVRTFPDRDLFTAEDSSGSKIHFEARSRLVPGINLEFLYPDGSSRFHVLESFEDANGNSLQEAHPNRYIRFLVDFPVLPFQVVRIAKNHEG